MRRDINFFTVYHSQINIENQDNFKMIALSFCAGSLIIILGIFSYLKFADSSLIKSMQSANNFIQSTQVMQAQQKIADGNSKMTALNNYLQAADDVASGFTQMPQINSNLLEKIAAMEPADVTVNRFSFSGVSLILNCTCTNNDSPAVFVHTLEQSGYFFSANYEGVASGNNNFSFDVTITLKGGSVK